MKPDYVLATAALLAGMIAQPALAGPNDFFGGSVPSSGPINDPLAGPAANIAPPPGVDFSDDEKHMQKRYKARMQHAKELIAKGTKMMKEGESKHNDKIFKKGDIIKKIGEKDLAELQANNPFPEQPKKGKDGKDKTSTQAGL